MISDFPKLECPFVRKTYIVSDEEFKKYRGLYNLRRPDLYLAVDQINPGYEWVFDDPNTIAVEKLDGTNVGVRTEKGRLEEVYNRENPIDFLKILGTSKGNLAIIEGILSSVAKGWVKDNDTTYGELIGPSVNNNPLRLNSHLWMPFDKTVGSYKYKSFNKYDVTYDNLSSWFKDHLKSFCHAALNKISMVDNDVFAEGVIFYNLKRKAEGKFYMAKLRRDMFPWYYDKITIGEPVE